MGNTLDYSQKMQLNIHIVKLVSVLLFIYKQTWKMMRFKCKCNNISVKASRIRERERERMYV